MDIFNKYIKKNIYSITKVPCIQRNIGNNNGFIQFKISYDNFDKFINDLRTFNTLLPIRCVIYDETTVNGGMDFLQRAHLLQELNKLNIENIEFKLSDSTLPLYNSLMDKINWRHDDNTFLELTVDRRPVEAKNLNLAQARGHLLLPEEKLLWVDDNTLQKLKDKVDDKVLYDTDKLKTVVRHYIDKLDKHYNFSKLTPLDKVYLTYHYMKNKSQLNIQFANECTVNVNGVQMRKPSDYHWESVPYQTYIRRRGICEGQARLMRIFLNNEDMGLDAVSISGKTLNGELHEWVGINIYGRLYYCCLTNGGLLQPMSYIPNDDELYPKVYQPSYATNEQIRSIESHIRSLRK